MRMKLSGANPHPELIGLDELPGKANYFIGKDPQQWRTDVRTYSRVKYKQVYPGVDVVYYGNQQHLEYDFIVAPGSRPQAIRMAIEGTGPLQIDARGDLVLGGKSGVRQHKPFVYQETDSGRKEIDGRYVLLGPTLVGLELGPYDLEKQLIIDPILSYSTYLGGGGDDRLSLIAVDEGGNAYVTGQTNSADFPVSNAAQASYRGGLSDVFIAKLSATGELVYSTYLGGEGEDSFGVIAVDRDGNAYVDGHTTSRDFPTVNPLQSTLAGQFDGFVTKLNAMGSGLVYSTYLGGSGRDDCNDIKVDANGSVSVAGQTTSIDFPMMNPAQRVFGGGSDGFVAKLTETGSALVYSTYIGGGGGDAVIGIAIDSAGNAYVHGQTNSLNFPTRNPLQATFGGIFDVFVAKLDPSGTSFLYSTYLGGSGRDLARAIAVDEAGNAYITGFAGSPSFPTVNAVQSVFGGGDNDAFVAKLNPNGTELVYSTFLGGAGRDAGEGLAVDAAGNAYVGGFTASTNFPVVNALQEQYGGPPGGGAIGGDGFVAKLSADGSTLVYSTYLGGSGSEEIVFLALDTDGNIYVTGQTTSDDFPTVNPFQPVHGGGPADVFVTKISEVTRPYAISDRGAFSFMFRRTSDLNVGYARIRSNGGSGTPSGVAIFGYRSNNVLVSEAGVPASPLNITGRFYAEVGGPVNTGVAVANPNEQPVTFTFSLTDETGQNTASRNLTIPPNGQVAGFLSETLFGSIFSFRGTLTFNASAPVGVTALRGFTNERAEFLITTLPVFELASTVSETVVVPHFADGGGWTTAIVLVNPTDSPLSGSIQFFGQGSGTEAAQQVAVRVNNQDNSTFAYVIPPRTSIRFHTAGATSAVRVGSVRVTPAATNRTPSALAIFSFKAAGVTVTEAGVPALVSASAFRLYVAASGDLQSGLAIANTSLQLLTVNLELTTLDGASVGSSSTVTIPPQGQVALFLGQIQSFQSLKEPFQGVLRISAPSAALSVVGLRGRYNERRDFLITSIPSLSESNAASSAELVFPHWASGGGYTTEFILIGVPSQIGRGSLGVFSQAGKPII